MANITKIVTLLFLCGCLATKAEQDRLADPDEDGDLHPYDCNSQDPQIHQDAEELCDGVDNNCDGLVDEVPGAIRLTWYLDTDLDGYGGSEPAYEEVTCTPQDDNATLDAGDCNDEDEDVNPDARDLDCDHVDEDCDGVVENDAWYVSTESSTQERWLTDLQDALDQSEGGDCILVEPGTYTGSFDWRDKNLTIRGAGPEETTLHGNGDSHVINIQGVSRGGLSGFTIEGGAADNGGGIRMVDSDVSLQELTVQYNSASQNGGGVYVEVEGAEISLQDVYFVSNVAEVDGGGLYISGADTGDVDDNYVEADGLRFELNKARGSGGGIAVNGVLYAEIEDLSITANEAALGGGMSILDMAYVDLIDFEVSENTATTAGGGLYVASGGSVGTMVESSELNRVFANTSDGDGGGVYLDGAGPDYSPESTTSSWLQYLSLVANTAGGDGGGLFVSEVYGDDVNEFEYLVIAGNDAAYGGGAFLDNSNFELNHTTLVGNRSDQASAVGMTESWLSFRSSIVAMNVAEDTSHTVTGDVPSCSIYSNVWSNTAPYFSSGWMSMCLRVFDSSFEDHNLSVDPEFVSFDLDDDPTTWDLHLAPGSPMIHAGEPRGEMLPLSSRTDIGALGPAE